MSKGWQIPVLMDGGGGGATITVTDTAQGSDSIAQILAGLTVADSGLGLDAFGPLANSFTLSDAAAGLDLLQAQVALSVTDLAQGADAIGILQALLKVVTDTATGVDSIPGISVAVPVADSGQGLDIIAALTVAAQVVDAAQGFDAVVRITGEGPTRRIVITFAAKQPAIAFGPGKQPGIIFN